MRRRMPQWPWLILDKPVLPREPVCRQAIPRPAEDRRHVLPDRRRRPVRHRRLGSSQRRRSRARTASCSSSRPTAKSRRSGASWPPTSSAASTSTAKSARREREYSVRQLVHRVARTIADWGLEDGYFATPAGRRAVLPRARLALPASARRVQLARVVQRRPVPPVRRQRREVQLALGSRRRSDVVQPENPYEYPQGSACFIQHVADNMEDIMELARSEAMLFKFGSGTGTDLSTLRSHREKLAGGGKPSGPALLHARLRPGRGRREERRQDPPRRQDAVASRSGTPT